MKRLHTALSTALPAALLIGLFAGCDGGVVGPRGPQGPRGDDGVVDVFSVNFVFSLQNAIINDNVASAQFDVPGITASVVDDGAVLMFFREQGTWTAMPFTYGIESADPDLDAVDYTVALNFGYELGFVEPFYEASINLDQIPDEVLPDREMKAVIIDAYLAGKTSVDLTDYEAVKRAFGLED